jgi:hypothetical protein
MWCRGRGVHTGFGQCVLQTRRSARRQRHPRLRASGVQGEPDCRRGIVRDSFAALQSRVVIEFQSLHFPFLECASDTGYQLVVARAQLRRSKNGRVPSTREPRRDVFAVQDHSQRLAFDLPSIFKLTVAVDPLIN